MRHHAAYPPNPDLTSFSNIRAMMHFWDLPFGYDASLWIRDRAPRFKARQRRYDAVA